MVQRNKICSYCDTAYVTTQYKSKYCTPACRVASNNANARNKKESTRLSKAEKRLLAYLYLNIGCGFLVKYAVQER